MSVSNRCISIRTNEIKKLSPLPPSMMSVLQRRKAESDTKLLYVSLTSLSYQTANMVVNIVELTLSAGSKPS